MILSPYVFLQVTPHAPLPDPAAATTLYWTPLSALVSLRNPPKWSTVSVDASSRLTPRHSRALRLLVRVLVGSMEFPAIVLDSSPPSPPISSSDSKNGSASGAPKSRPQLLKLWGLSLGMALDLMCYMTVPIPSGDPQILVRKNAVSSRASTPLSQVMQLPYNNSPDGLRMEVVAPSLASVFPRFSYPDVNFWIWLVFSLFCSHIVSISFQGIWKTLS